MRMGQLNNRIHIYRKAVDMNRHDRFCVPRNLGRNQGGIEVPGVGLAVDNDGRCAGADDRGSSRDNGECGQNDFVAMADTKRSQRHVNGNAPVADGNAVLAAHQLREASLKPLNKGAFGGNPAGLYALA